MRLIYEAEHKPRAHAELFAQLLVELRAHEAILLGFQAIFVQTLSIIAVLLRTYINNTRCFVFIYFFTDLYQKLKIPSHWYVPLTHNI